MKTVHEWAQDLSTRGLAVHPIKAGGKAPREKGWQKIKRRSPEQVAAVIPRDYVGNIGVNCLASDVLVIDEDERGALEAFINDGGYPPLPKTFTVSTPNGRHYYFAYDYATEPSIGNSGAFRALGCPIDVRGAGGQVVAPGSTHATGSRYEVETDSPIAPLPAWLYDFLRASSKAASAVPDSGYGGFDMTWEEILAPLGWVRVGVDGANELWRHPKATSPHSGAGLIDGNNFQMFSTSVKELPPDGYTRIGLYAALHHGGDMRKARKSYEESRLPQAVDEFTPLEAHEQVAAKKRLTLTPASAVRVVKPRFVKPLWYPVDVITLVAGRGGAGKSTLVLGDVAAATRGELGGDVPGALNVVISAPEDTLSLQVARLKAAGADLSRVYFLGVESDGVAVGAPMLARDEGEIRECLRSVGAAMWVIDPITSIVKGDLSKREDVRATLDPLTTLARELELAVVAVAHFNKGEGKAADKIAGSAAFRDVARSALVVALDESAPGSGIVTIDKSNYGAATGKSWEYTITAVEVEADSGERMSISTASVSGETHRTVEQLINRKPNSDEAATVSEVTQFIYDYLKKCDGNSAAAKEVINAGRDEGYKPSQITTARHRAKSPKIISDNSPGVAATWSLEFVPESDDLL